jgi:uncharacterized membrane protein YoaK (UPF0700 family)
MYQHRLTDAVGLKTYLDWLLLAFLAGAINAGGFLACNRFVSHVTGFATIAGVDFAQGEWGAAFGILTVPLYFLGGVMLSAYLIDRRAHEGKKPRYALVMSLVTILLLLSAIGGFFNFWGPFGDEMLLRDDYFLLSFLCAASGLQNAALTSATGATIRITHLTGLTTDLGIGLVRAAKREKSDPERRLEMITNAMRAGTILAFMLGSAVGAVLYLKYQYLGFLMPAAIAAYATWVAVQAERSA